MNTYTIKQINDYTYLINDDDFCTTYLLIGKDKALVIDVGIKTTSSLLNEIRKITDKELMVFITHGHFDHIGHLNEFDSYYICKDDLNLIKSKRLLKKARLFKNKEVFDFNTFKIKVLFLKGHTQGSVIFIDETSKIFYTGDQFGSGCGVWMQVKTATNISTYLKSIKYFKKYIKENYSDYKEFIFYGGHYGQEYTSRLNVYNPLNLSMLDDFEVLCKKLLKNEVELEFTMAKRFNKEKSYYVKHNRSEMIIRKSLIK